MRGVDETELLLPLHAGALNGADLAIFLNRVRRRTSADEAMLIMSPARSGSTSFRFLSSPEGGAAGDEVLDRIERHGAKLDLLRPGRVYSPDDFDIGEEKVSGTGLLRLQGDMRILRVRSQAQINAWLAILASDARFVAADSALMTGLEPHIAVSLRNVVEMERYSLAAAAAAQGMQRSGVVWVALGRDERVLAFDIEREMLLNSLLRTNIATGRRLPITAMAVQDEVVPHPGWEAASNEGNARILCLSEDRRLWGLLAPMPLRHPPFSYKSASVLYLRAASTPIGFSPDTLATVFGLTKREAELVRYLCAGRTIAEAALAMNITQETARTYSKAVFAKMDVRGQVEVVRAVFTSVAALI